MLIDIAKQTEIESGLNTILRFDQMATLAHKAALEYTDLSRRFKDASMRERIRLEKIMKDKES